MATYDRMVFGMHHLNITQIGTAYTGSGTYSHPSWELDLAGEDTGIDYWYNLMKNTGLKCLGTWGTSGTYFFGTCDPSTGAKKNVYCADGKLRVITLAMTHSARTFTVGKIYKTGEVVYTEGTKGKATGNHIHLEVAEGWQTTKVQNSKGYYNVTGIMDARKVFFIYTPYTTVISNVGINFKTCTELTYTEPTYKNTASSAKNNNDIHYRVHVADYGSLPAVHDGSIAGNIESKKQVEAFLLNTSRTAGMDLTAKAHIQGTGWVTYEHIKGSTWIGTTGQSKRLEAFEIVVNENKTGKNLYYQCCYSDSTWTTKTAAGYSVGTVGRNLPIIGIKIWIE